MTHTQPLCDFCWATRTTDRGQHRLTGPARQTEQCCLCGKWTRSGIYVRIDPTAVPYPTSEVSHA